MPSDHFPHVVWAPSRTKEPDQPDAKENVNMWRVNATRSVSVILIVGVLASLVQATPIEPNQAAAPITDIYFGQTAPGETPVLFAPQILNAVSPWVEATELSPDGTMFFVGVGDASYSSARLKYSKFENGAWTPFVDAPFISNFDFSHEAVFSPGGDTVTFTARSGSSANDLWVVQYSAGAWGTPVALPAPINSSAKEWRGSRSDDGTFYFGSTRAIANNNQIFRAYTDSTHTLVAEKLGTPINNGTYEGDPCVAPDGHFLIFYSGRSGGSTDLYVSFKTNTGAWGKPINLGAGFNSGYDEYGAHLSHNGKYLFFTRHTTSGNQIYWVSISAVEKLAVPTVPSLQMVGYSITESAGNHDGRAQAGETITISTTIRNAGSDATGITGTLSTEDPFVSIGTENTVYPALAWKAQGASATPFTITVDPGCPDPHIAILSLETNSATGGGFIDTILLYIGDQSGFDDDMESGMGLWKHKGVSSGYGDQWHLETSQAHTLSTSWKLGGAGLANYADKCDGGLVSPPVLLPEKGKLTFWHRLDAEQKDEFSGYDGAIVMISNGIGQWTSLTPSGGYPLALSSGTALPAGTRCFSGSTDWVNTEFDLTLYSGVHQFMFRFVSDMAVTGEGWYIDDVRVSGCCQSLSGNVDCDPGNGTDISDLAALIDYLYISFNPPCCRASANVDGLAGIDISDLTALIDYLYISFTPPSACQ